MKKLTFEDVCNYAEWLGFKHRGEPSKSHDWTQKYVWNGWLDRQMMVLYEGPKRIVRGHKEPEVCWICVTEDGRVLSVPSRHLRKMELLPGFAFSGDGRNCINEYFDTINTKENTCLLCRMLAELEGGKK